MSTKKAQQAPASGSTASGILPLDGGENAAPTPEAASRIGIDTTYPEVEDISWEESCRRSVAAWRTPEREAHWARQAARRKLMPHLPKPEVDNILDHARDAWVNGASIAEQELLVLTYIKDCERMLKAEAEAAEARRKAWKPIII